MNNKFYDDLLTMDTSYIKQMFGGDSEDDDEE